MLNYSSLKPFAIIAALFSGFPLASVAAAEIDWQVEHRFRLFKYQSDFELHRIAYDYLARQQTGNGFASNPVRTMEHLLNDPAWLAVVTGSNSSNLLSSDRQRHDQLSDDPILAEEGRAWRRLRGGDGTGLPRFGWAAQSWNRTCWDAGRQTYKGCERQFERTGVLTDGDYLTPKRHLVTARVDDPTLQAGEACVWQADAPVFRSGQSERTLPHLSITAPCSGVELFVPYPDTVALSAALPGGSIVQANIAIADLLVVSLGDSFASGEGNPDLPVQMADAAFFEAFIPESGAYSETRGVSPRADWGQPAHWFDRRCHRSLYSHHVRTAIYLALRERRKSVTYLGLGCSGAEITEGLLSTYAGKEDAANIGPVEREQSQMRALMYELCGGALDDRTVDYTREANEALLQRDPHREDRSFKYTRYSCPGGAAPSRSIDLLFLSIGINDIGFSPLLADAILRSGSGMRDGKFLTNSRRSIARRVARAHGLADHFFGIGGRTKLANLSGRYALMRGELAGLALAEGDAKRVLVTAYPKTGIAEDPCSGKNHGMTVFAEFNPDQDRLDALATFTGDDEPDNSPSPDTLYGKIVRELGAYSVVNAHRNEFSGHGFCAFSEPAEDFSPAEFSYLPYGCKLYRGRDWRTCSPNPNGEPSWRYFNPFNEAYPYKSRTRWIRTINDAYQFVNYFPGKAPFSNQRRRDSDPVPTTDAFRYLSMGLGGPFHPTAEGHSVVADALADKALEVLRARGQVD